MRKPTFIVIASAVAFLFFFQMAGTLVESIYILDLLNTALDEKALGLLFFFSPLLLVFFREKIPGWFVWIIFGLLFAARGSTPYLNTNGRLVSSGIGTSAVLLLLPMLITAKPRSKHFSCSGHEVTAGLALGIGISIMLRTIHFSIDYSLTAGGSWIGWLLALLLGLCLSQIDLTTPRRNEKIQGVGVISATLGIILVLTLATFVFSAPSVLARWTEGSYPLIISATSLMTLSWVALLLYRPVWIEHTPPKVLLAWNLLFTASLLATIMVHRVSFPDTLESTPVVVGSPNLIQHIPLFLSLLLFPVIFIDLRFFASSLQDAAPGPRELLPGMILGSLSYILLVFMNIFTNVWGYVEPVSPHFRNKFWLPFALITGFLTILGNRHNRRSEAAYTKGERYLKPGWVLTLVVIFLFTSGSAFRTTKTVDTEADQNSIRVMTYNIQQANNVYGEKAYKAQLELIQQVSPDILALQESDSARISLNNNDYVRYFAGKLGYYSYYGPTTVSGTYGTAILSKFPLQNTYTLFSYSDQDEIGTTVAEIHVSRNTFTIYNVHPAGSDAAMMAFARALLTDAAGKEKVIALGDYNLREEEDAYQLVDAAFTNAWLRVYPTGISDAGLDMTGNKRIDHIFVSPDLDVRNTDYILAPESHTDHPAHWAQITWQE